MWKEQGRWWLGSRGRCGPRRRRRRRTRRIRRRRRMRRRRMRRRSSPHRYGTRRGRS